MSVAVALAFILLILPSAQSAEAVAPTVTPLPPVEHTADHMGTCWAFYEVSGTPLAPIAHAAGSRWDRLDFRWDAISQNGYQPHKRVVSSDRSAGLEIVGILWATPQWAADPECVLAGTWTEASEPYLLGHPRLSAVKAAADNPYRICPPANLDSTWDHPDNYWGKFVFDTVTNFRDSVKVWEIWNEPDLGHTFWSGTPEQYAQLLRVAYQAVKAADPEAKVLFAGLAYWSDPTYYVAVLNALQSLPGSSQHNGYFDVMSLHLYSNVYTIRPVVAEIQAAMAARVGPHPIWLTETGVPLWDETPPDGLPGPPRTNYATAEEAATYVIEAFAEARAAGVERFFFFRTHDESMDDYFGMLRNDLSYRPAYVAFQVAAEYLHDENQITGPFTYGNVRRITFWATPHGRVDVLWNTSGVSITTTHSAVLPTATVVNQAGVTTTLVATNGAFNVTLPAATANTAEGGGYLMGGPPLLIIQRDLVPPISELLPLPNETYTHTILLHWDASDDASGYWYEEIQRAPAPDGPWTRVAAWNETRGVTQTSVAIPTSGTWYFRARARDNVGNWENWPSSAEAWTTAVLTRTVFLSVTTYVDADRDGEWDRLDPAEAPQPNTALSWRSPDGRLIGQKIGETWQVTETVEIGEHTISCHSTDAIAVTNFNVPGGRDVLEIALSIGMQPIVGRVFLPLILQTP